MNAPLLDRLREFGASKMARYKERRDFPAEDVTSGLSENLTYGEISPRTCWLAGQRALDEGNPGAGKFLSELVLARVRLSSVVAFPRIGRGELARSVGQVPLARGIRGL